MTTRNKIVTGGLGLVIIFLLGFMPQYLPRRELQGERRVCNEKLGMSELQNLAGMMLLEVLQQNYGTARAYSTEYFAKVGERSGSVQDAPLKSSLQELLSKRDSITTILAKADPGSTSEVQALFVQTHELTKLPQ